MPPKEEIHIHRARNRRYNPRSGRTCESLNVRATFRDVARLGWSLYSYDHWLGVCSIEAGQRQEMIPDSPAFQPQPSHTTDYGLGELLATWGLNSSSSTIQMLTPQYKILEPNTVQSQNFGDWSDVIVRKICTVWNSDSCVKIFKYYAKHMRQ